MKKIFIFVVLVSFGVLSFLIGGDARPPGPQGYTPLTGEPSLLASWSNGMLSTLQFPGGDVLGAAHYDMFEKQVAIGWRHPPSHASAHQVLSTSFWPTAIASTNNGQSLCVSGKRKNGNTVVEVWDFAEPLVMQVPPSTWPPPPIGGTPPPSHVIMPAQVLLKKTVFDAAEQGRDTAFLMATDKAISNAVVLQFWDSRDLYHLDLATGQLTMVASPSPGLVFHAPPLSLVHNKLESMEHVTHGLMYMLYNTYHPEVGPYYLADNDKDGVIDVLLDASGYTEQALGLGDPDDYVH